MRFYLPPPHLVPLTGPLSLHSPRLSLTVNNKLLLSTESYSHLYQPLLVDITAPLSDDVIPLLSLPINHSQLLNLSESYSYLYRSSLSPTIHRVFLSLFCPLSLQNNSNPGQDLLRAPPGLLALDTMAHFASCYPDAYSRVKIGRGREEKTRERRVWGGELKGLTWVFVRVRVR